MTAPLSRCEPRELETINLQANPRYPDRSDDPFILRYPKRPAGSIRLAKVANRNWRTKRVKNAAAAETFLILEGDRGILPSIRVGIFATWYLNSRFSRSPHIGVDCRSAFKQLCAVAHDVAFGHLDEDVFAAVDAHMENTSGLTAHTRRNYLCNMQGLIRRAIELGLIDHDPVAAQIDAIALPPPRADTVPSPEDADLAVMRREATALEGAVLELAAEGGARGREIVNLTWPAIDLIGRTLVLPAVQYQTDSMDHSRVVHLTDSLLLALFRLRLQRWRQGAAADNRVFPGWTGSYLAGRHMQGLQARCGRTVSSSGKLRIADDTFMEYKMLTRAPGVKAARGDGRWTAVRAATGLQIVTVERHYKLRRMKLPGHRAIGQFPALGEDLWSEKRS